LKLFLDNNLSPYLADALNCLLSPDGHHVTCLRRKFPENTPDSEWIARLASEGGWVIISGDREILRKGPEKAVWRSAKLMGFFLAKGWMCIDPIDQSWRLLKWWPAILKQVEVGAPGATYLLEVNPKNKIQPL
jgi:hypothetical protein